MKGLSAALGAAISLGSLGDFGPFRTLCSVAGGAVESVVDVGVGIRLSLVTGTFVGVLVGDLFLRPFCSASG